MLRLGAERIGPPAGVAGRGAQVYEIDAAAVTAPRRAAGYAESLRRLESDRGVTLAGLSSPGAIVGLGRVAVAVDESVHTVVHHLLSADSFRALGLRVVAGRAITDADGWVAPRVAVVIRNSTRHLGGDRAVGKRILLGYGPDAEHTIVGVVGDDPPMGLGGTLEPKGVVYASVLQHPAADVSCWCVVGR